MSDELLCPICRKSYALQEYLLYGGLPPHEHTETSLDAALSILPFAHSMRERVFHYFESCQDGRSTADAAEEALNMLHQTCTARVRELVQLGRLVNTGETRRTRSGRRGAVYVTVDHSAPVPAQAHLWD